MYRFAVPVEGLVVSTTTVVGPVIMANPRDTRDAVESGPRARSMFSDDLDASLGSGAAVVSATTIEEAVGLVESALAVMRVCMQSSALMRTPDFGLAGDAWRAVLPYVQLGAGDGWIHRGHFRGVTWGERQAHEFSESSGFEFAATAIGVLAPSDGQRRALLGVELASRALLETRHDMQLLFAVVAAEAMLLQRSRGSQSLLLARRVSYFLCGLRQGSLCGRDRDTCPLLGIHPDSRGGASRLNARAHRCSQFARVLDWYDDRSDVAHAGSAGFPEGEQSRAMYWLLTSLIPEGLDWFERHPKTPIADLESAIEQLPRPLTDEAGRFIADRDPSP